MTYKKNLFLVGPMGAGKTSVGRALAQELELEYYDTDQEIQDRTGADIPWIFDIEGEKGFRDREAAVVDELTQKKGIILSTGGGAILRKESREAMSKRGLVIYLHVSFDQQVKRTHRTGHRPLLQRSKDTRATLEKLREEREPLYEEIADLTYNTDDKTVQDIVTEILKDVRKS